MAKPKKPKQVAPARAVTSAAAIPGSIARSSLFKQGDKLTLKGYIVMNLIWDAFCIFQLLFIRYTLNETRGLYYFFGLLMVGFLVVSIYDYAYDRLVPRTADEE